MKSIQLFVIFLNLLGKPFFPITLRNTKEVAGFNGLAEALIRLDFTNAIRDVRRFNYVASLMQLLFSHDKLSQLPGKFSDMHILQIPSIILSIAINSFIISFNIIRCGAEGII